MDGIGQRQCGGAAIYAESSGLSEAAASRWQQSFGNKTRRDPVRRFER
jgi:hypothetical protein